ncbi:lysozyme [Megalopta genalis]|uniref:lysozyme n=1 Tax=Megalopta genalis TaxID=115081 RepID=UPI0014434CDD|nr:lysozyme-like [Megalopta genalis]
MSPNMLILTIFLNLCLLFGQHDTMTEALTISKTCFGCICEAASGCNVTIGCNESVCGPFRITWAYWSDAGKPNIENSPGQTGDGYLQCVNDPYCAARAVQGYMEKFAQDCNGDGNINCDDFLRIHRLGGYGCSSALNAKYEDTYKRCMATYNV